MQSSLRLTGIGLRAPHVADFLEKRPQVAWVEVQCENYFGDGGKGLHLLDNVRRDYPISLHGVSLSLGSVDDLNWQYLKKLKDLIARIDPCLISDHVAWSSVDGQYLHDLLPLPFTNETLDHFVTRTQQVQEFLQRQILIENISSYVRFEHSTMTEWEFLQAAATRAGCGILLDVNNIYVNATNFGFNPDLYAAALNPALVQEIHVGGFTETTVNEKPLLLGTHSKPVVPAVWDLYQRIIHQLGRKPTIVEWDTDLPSLETLCLEAYRAEKIMRESYVATKLTA